MFRLDLVRIYYKLQNMAIKKKKKGRWTVSFFFPTGWTASIDINIKCRLDKEHCGKSRKFWSPAVSLFP